MLAVGHPVDGEAAELGEDAPRRGVRLEHRRPDPLPTRREDGVEDGARRLGRVAAAVRGGQQLVRELGFLDGAASDDQPDVPDGRGPVPRAQDVDAYSFSVGVTIASATAVATPIANGAIGMSMVGKYKFSDYVLYAGPYTVLATLVLIFLVPALWPL